MYSFVHDLDNPRASFEFREEVAQTKLAIETLVVNKMKDDARDVAVQKILDHEKIYTERQDNEPIMYIYKDGIYVPDARTYIRHLCEFFFDKAYTKHVSNEVISRIEAQTYIDAAELYQVKHPYIIPLQNGLLNLRTGSLDPFDPDKVFFAKLPIIYDANKDCPAIKKFLSEVVNPGDVQIIREQFGYTLLKAYPIPKCFLYTGMGRNGKSTVLQLQKEFLGPENTTNVPLQDLETDQYSKSELFGKLACLGGDLGSSGLKDTGNFKSLTGSDTISAARKFMTRIHFKNYAKLIFSANQVPYSKDTSDGFFSRWVIIDFPHRFYTQEEIDCMTPEESVGVKVADRHIIDKLTTPDELSGLLNWSLQGLQTILQNGSLSTNASTENIRNTYLLKSNSLSAFVSRHCSTEDANATILKDDFRKFYHAFCQYHNVPIKSDKAILLFMKDNDVWQTKSMSNRYWQGIYIVNRNLGQEGQLGHPFHPLGEVDEKSNLPSTQNSRPTRPSEILTNLEKAKHFITLHQENNALQLELVFGEEQIRQWVLLGEIFETGNGAYRVV